MATAQAQPAISSIGRDPAEVNPDKNSKDLISASAVVRLIEAAVKTLTPHAALAVALMAAREAAAEAWGETSSADLIRSLGADRKTIARPEIGVLAQAFLAVDSGRYRLDPKWQLGNFSKNKGETPAEIGGIIPLFGEKCHRGCREVIPLLGKISQARACTSNSIKNSTNTSTPHPTHPITPNEGTGTVGEVVLGGDLDGLVEAMLCGIPGANLRGVRKFASEALRTASSAEISDLLTGLRERNLAALVARPHLLTSGKIVISAEGVVGRILKMLGNGEIPRLLDAARRAYNEAAATSAEDEARAARRAEAEQALDAACQANPALQDEGRLRDAYLDWYAGDLSEPKFSDALSRATHATERQGLASRLLDSVPSAEISEAYRIWESLRQSLASRLPERIFQDWIVPCKAVNLDGSTLWILTPSPSARVWIQQELAEEFHDALHEASLQYDTPNLRLAFTVAASPSVAERMAALGLRARQGAGC